MGARCARRRGTAHDKKGEQGSPNKGEAIHGSVPFLSRKTGELRRDPLPGSEGHRPAWHGDSTRCAGIVKRDQEELVAVGTVRGAEPKERGPVGRPEHVTPRL